MIELVEAVSSAIKLANSLLGLVGTNLDLKNGILDLKGQLADIKSTVLDLRTENEDLKAQLARRKNPSQTEFKNGVLYTLDGEGPYCPVCHAKGSNLHMCTDTAGSQFKVFGKYRCSVCKQFSG